MQGRSHRLRGLVGGVVLAAAISGVTGTGAWWLGLPWPGALGDLLFAEGALLLVAGGLVDVGASLTVARIATVRDSRFTDPPPAVRKPGVRYLLLVAGLVLCLQGAVLAYRIGTGGR